MKHRTIYCLLTLAGLVLSPLAYSSPDLRGDNEASLTQDRQGQPAKSDGTQSGVSLNKVGPGTLALNYVVRRNDGDTKVEVIAEGGAFKKVSATDADGTRALKPVKAGVRLVQPCGAEGQANKSLTLEDGQTVKISICKARLQGLLLPAVQKIREAAARTKSTTTSNNRISGGASCTEDKPCCFEDEKLSMTVCWHS